MVLHTITNKAKVRGDKNPNDEYYTPVYAIRPLLQYIRPASTIWCPFDTEESNYVKLLRAEGHIVYNSHIFQENDFFTIPPPANTQYIISNPPYSKKNEVLERLFSLNIPFAMLFGVVGIFESKKRFSLFKRNGVEVMYFDKRISYLRSYADTKPVYKPPFSSVYICKGVLPKEIVFEEIAKENK